MDKTKLLGLVFFGGMGCVAVGCDSASNSGNLATGGQYNAGTGGSTWASGGAASTGGKKGTGGATQASQQCGTNVGDAGLLDVDGGLAQIGNTDPTNALTLDVGGYYKQGDEYKGFCFTFADARVDGSTMFPPCGGGTNKCFTVESKLCAVAALGKGSATVWGGGIGCSLNMDQAGKEGDPLSVANVNSIEVQVYGCTTPNSLRLQLNVYPPIYEEEKDLLHSGYYCADVALSDPDAEGFRSGSVNVADLVEDCWNGPGLNFDPSTQTVTSLQLQINASNKTRTDYDFCVSKFQLK